MVLIWQFFNNLNLGQGEEVLYPMLSYDSELLEEYIKENKVEENHREY